MSARLRFTSLKACRRNTAMTIVRKPHTMTTISDMEMSNSLNKMAEAVLASILNMT